MNESLKHCHTGKQEELQEMQYDTQKEWLMACYIEFEQAANPAPEGGF